MNKRTSPVCSSFLTTATLVIVWSFNTSLASAQGNPSANAQRIFDHWSKQRINAAIPRDMLIDNNGQGYIRNKDGTLRPYGHSRQLTAQKQSPYAKPPGAGDGNDDTTVPSITFMSPEQGESIGSSSLFSAVITDASGIKSVSFVITYPDGVTTQSFRPGFVGNDNWQMTLQGFSDGNWSWHVVAKDNASKGGNTATSVDVDFIVSTGSTGGGGNEVPEHVISNAAWTAGGVVLQAAGRIYFEMPNNSKRKGPWTGYVCSGTVATDGVTGRSVIITAAHCVYDDENKAFARNVLFIPNQAGTTGSGTDTNCNNDPMGCWAPAFGVVDVAWTTTTFPNNIEWDYAYYVVSDTGAHSGTNAPESLDIAAGSMDISFLLPSVDDGNPATNSADFTHALGYSYSDDPNFMYSAEDMTTEGSVNWWLANSGLTGGSSGGPWVQAMDEITGDGPVISVNSWGYTSSPGMAGPKFIGTSAGCLFTESKGIDFVAVSTVYGDEGVVIDYCP